MHISRIVIRNLRSFEHLDVKLNPGATCIIGENNAGKTNLIHALRLATDASLPSSYRSLIENDINNKVDITKPTQVLVSVELEGWEGKVSEEALVACWKTEDDTARLTYRFRPRPKVREEIENEEREATGLTLDDYSWSLVGGGPNDPATVKWNEDHGGAIRFSDLQYYKVVSLFALRDVTKDLKNRRESPLYKALSTADIKEKEKKELVQILSDANDAIAKRPSIKKAGSAIEKSFQNTSGDAYQMGLKIGMTDPSYSTITSALTVLLTDNALENFEPARNGLGLNNILYTSMLLEYFERRIEEAETAGQLLLIEEPEAHLHPQLQRVLYENLAQRKFQTILTTHSTHISSKAPLKSLITLTKNNKAEVQTAALTTGAELTTAQTADLERYLDATRSTLLYARKVILVEGPAELFLIPPLIKQIMGIDLDSHGISVVPIHGTHFAAYTKLFSKNALQKKCAIIADKDLKPSDIGALDKDELEEFDDLEDEPVDLDALEGDYVKVFKCKTTFERAVTMTKTLPMMIQAAADLGAVKIQAKLQAGYDELVAEEMSEDERIEKLEPLRDSVLNTAKRFGKARFAQVASSHVDKAETLPKYISRAVKWLLDE